MWLLLFLVKLVSKVFRYHSVFCICFRNFVFNRQSEIVHGIFFIVNCNDILYFQLYAFRLGSLIKLVYFSRHAELSTEDKRKISTKRRLGMFNGGRRSYPILGGRLHFVKFETEKLNECLDFISSKQLHRGGMLTLLRIVNNWLYHLHCFCHLVVHIVFYDFSIASVHL